MHKMPSIVDKAIFLERLKKLKLENNVKSEQLADYLNISLETYLNTVECDVGRISWKIVYAIEDFFNVQLDYLCGYTQHPNDEFYDSDIFVYLSERIRELEWDSDYLSEDIAKYLEISIDEYTNIRLGKKEPSLDVLANLANYFNVSLDYLIKRSNDPMRH